MTALLAVIRRAFYPLAVLFMGRGEVAEAPPYLPDLPRIKTCPLNAQPHWCCDPEETR